MRAIDNTDRAEPLARGIRSRTEMHFDFCFRAPLSAHHLFSRKERGVALLAVLWLSVALTFMAMATAQLVRTEVTATRNQIDAERSYYLARGGIEAAVDSIVFTAGRRNTNPDAPVLPSEFVPGRRWLQFDFETGSSVVEVVPENAKLNINQIRPEQLASLLEVLGFSSIDSADIAAAIVEWRSPRASDVDTPLDTYYKNLPDPYVARHAGLDQLEELLPVKGISHDLFFGRTERTPEGKWRRLAGLNDLLTTQATGGAVNPNYAPYAVLRVLPGWTDPMAAAAIAAREQRPFRSLEDLVSAVPGFDQVETLAPLTFAGGPVYTLTATGFVPGSGVRRSLRVLVRIGTDQPMLHRVLGWWDEWPTPENIPAPANYKANGNNGSLS